MYTFVMTCRTFVSVMDVTAVSMRGGVVMRHLRITVISRMMICHFLNPLTAKLFNLNFHPLEVVSR